MLDYIHALQKFAESCIGCGLCAKTDCGNYPGGEPFLGQVVQELLEGNEDHVHFPYTCALCNRCTVDCPKGLKAIDACKPARALILKKYPDLRNNYRHFRTDLKHNLFSMVKGLELGDISEMPLVEGERIGDSYADTTAFFPGCSLNAYAPQLSEASFEWLRNEKIASRKLNFCCGATFFDTGFFEEFAEFKARAAAYLESLGIKRLVIVCPHCGYELPQLLEDTNVELLRLPDLLVERGLGVPGVGTYSVHDACYDRLDGNFGSAVRKLMGHWEEHPLPHTGAHTICCGGGGMVSAYAPDYCEYRRNQRLAEMDSIDADVLISTCFSCVNSMQRGDASKPVRHYLELLFDIDIDWAKVYGGVDAMYRHPLANELLAGDDPMFSEASGKPDVPAIKPAIPPRPGKPNNM